MQAFYRTPLANTEPMEPQINKLIEASRNLEAIGCGVNNKTLAYMIIMALPLSLSMLKAILYNKDDNTITSKEVIAQILADEEQRVSNLGDTTVAYFAKVGKKGNSKRRDDNRGKKCSYCKKRNHNASECRKKKKDKDEKNNTSNAKGNTGNSSASMSTKAHVAIVEDDIIRLLDSDDDTSSSAVGHALMARVVDGNDEAKPPPLECFLPLSNSTFNEYEYALITRQDLDEDNMSENWLIDSGASRVMCSHRHWF